MKLLSVVAVLLGVVASLARADEAEIERKVAALLARMTQEEKIGQLAQYSVPGRETGPAERANIEEEIAAARCGSLLNAIGPEETRALQRLAVEETRLGIPLLFGFDVVHGYRTIFPINLGQAASWDLEAIEASERIAATETAAAGIHWTFAPMVDIARDPRWGRIAEGSGEDPFLGGAIAAARVRGFQGDDLARVDTILACAKHFAGYGAAQGGRDYHTTDIPEITLRDVYLPPFKAAVDAGVGTFMAAFNDLNGVPATANAFLFQDILRGEWGFHGFVVSDWDSVKELLAHGVAADEAEACRLAMNAGVDMDMQGGIYAPQMAAQLASGAVSAERLDAAVGAILAAKFRLGLFDDPYRYSDEARERAETLRPESLEFARDFARKSCVLLKNADETLPLKPDARIALIGELANSQRDLLGEWRGRGREEEAVSVRAGMEAAFPGRVRYVEGAKVHGDDRSGFKAAVAAAKKADVVVAVLGESWNMSGEAASRTELGLPGVQAELLSKLRDTGKPVVLVLFSGRPLALAPILDDVDALLLAWLPGTMGGPAIADLLSGAASPEGKLPVTFPRSLGQIPIFYNAKITGRPQDDATPMQKFRSNYLDAPNTPQFPFGFGLSYATFSYLAPTIERALLTPDGEQSIRVTVKNTGSRAGVEIAQLYTRDLVGSVTRPVRELKGFQRVALEPGESREIVFALKPSDLAFTRSDMSFGPEPGAFEVFVGGDSYAPLVGSFEYGE